VNDRIRLICSAMACAAALFLPAAAFAEPASGRPVDGIRCDQMEGSAFHIHQHLTLIDRGRAVEVPGDVGRPVVAQCLYWLHTHAPGGIIHIESPTIRSFTLGQFFDIWGQPLSATRAASLHASKKTQLRFWVNGMQYHGDPRKIELVQHADILIQAGPPWARPKLFNDWNGM